jgi:hypothetical protein
LLHQLPLRADREERRRGSKSAIFGLHGRPKAVGF